MKIWTTTHETETEYGVVVREQSGTQHRYALLIAADPDEDDCLEAAKRDVRRYLDLSPSVALYAAWEDEQDRRLVRVAISHSWAEEFLGAALGEGE